MLTTVPPAYPYRQYRGDDDIAAFFDAHNEGTQTYLDWFNQNPLAYYPGLSGDLLDWVAEGLYGMKRPALEQQGTPALGTLNTEVLNTVPLNTFTPPTAGTAFTLSDDVFKRILTWHLYKGDGKNFNMFWIKRRVMRFLVGVNGLDPQPPAVGAEDTSAISAVVASGILTIAISQARLATIAPAVSTQILTLFSLLLPSGFLDLPARYQYAVTLA
jgi:hypothetical protein